MKNWKYINGAEIGNSLIDKIQTIGKDSITMKSPNGDEVIIYKNGEAVLKKSGGTQAIAEHHSSMDAAIQKYKSQGYKIGNASVEEQNEKLFHSLEKDVEEKEEKNDEEIEEVGNSKAGEKNVWKEGPYHIEQLTEDGNFGWYKMPKGSFVAYRNDVVYGNFKTLDEAKRKLQDEINKDKEYNRKYTTNRTGNKTGNSEDDKFAYVMREFDEGKLKTPDGKVVKDPAQAKAIAYSESKKAENGLARARNAMACNKKVGNSIYSELNKSDKRVVIEADGSWYVYDKNDKVIEQGRESNADNALGKFKAKGYNKKIGNWNSERTIEPVGKYPAFLKNLKNAIDLGVAAVNYNSVDEATLKAWVEQAKKEGYGAHIGGVQGHKVTLK